ncbi:MgtC/SapB family protein [uncultured Amaricoccus sp.]|uniref:MgtC/SapB family protein n=1 Tax=uncultured Amaricoccus sp. TaxID=339341 RepID=UPI00262FCE57|nr:MgtC/SapB family protein [uncultured Amaricoccus sp.]
METNEIISRLAVALAIGLLVGLERGWRTRDEREHQRAAGLRTFALSGLLGGVAGLLALEFGGVLLGLLFAGFAATFALFQWLEARLDDNVSATTAVAGMLVFLLGALAVAGELVPAVAAAVAMTLLLALREHLHRWVAMLTWPEIRAVLTLAAMSFLLLPVIPDRTVDPWGTVNPHEIWLLAILIAGISFAGYVAVRAFGERSGIMAMAAAGGLVSSTATTLALAQMEKGQPGSARLLSAGILVSSNVMLVRVGLVALGLNPALLPRLALPLGAAALVLLAAALLLVWRTRRRAGPALTIDNPLAVGTALSLAAVMAAVMLAAELARRWLGDVGVLIVAGVSGVVDVDAVTISMARLSAGGAGLDAATAALAILVAVGVNTASKAVLAGWVGGRVVGGIVGGVGLLAAAAAGLAVLWPLAAAG